MNTYKSLPVTGQLMDEANASGVMRTVSPYLILSRTCAAFALSAACLFGATGCSSNYVIHTIDGKAYATQGAPEFSNGGYSFIDSSGHHQQLLLSQVAQVGKP